MYAIRSYYGPDAQEHRPGDPEVPRRCRRQRRGPRAQREVGLQHCQAGRQLRRNFVITSYSIHYTKLYDSQERREELAKVASKYAEQAKIAVRNVRRDGMDAVKKLQKDGEIS